jgi:ribosomal protein L11 methyltransferase
MVYSAFHFLLEPYKVENIEVLSALLDIYYFEGINEEESSLTAYIPSEKLQVEAMQEIKSTLAGLGCKLSWTHEDIAEQNWNKLWESNFEPVIIDTRCVVRAPFHREYPEILHRITIEPKMSFGTGHHATTRLMTEKILETDFKGKKILDIGCGTGILSILASMCGAENITAIDIDKWAFENTLENIQKNNISNIQVIQGGKESIPETKYDVILANINRNVLLDQMIDYSRLIKMGGLLLISGILIEDIEILKETAQIDGFYFNYEKILGNWVLLAFQRN